MGSCGRFASRWVVTIPEKRQLPQPEISRRLCKSRRLYKRTTGVDRKVLSYRDNTLRDFEFKSRSINNKLVMHLDSEVCDDSEVRNDLEVRKMQVPRYKSNFAIGARGRNQSLPTAGSSGVTVLCTFSLLTP